MEIKGDRNSTIEFENYFRRKARDSIEVYFEVVFWKLYSQKNIRQKKATEIIDNMLRKNVSPELLYEAINRFVNEPNKQNLNYIRNLMGIKTDVLAIPLTFPAFLNPEKYPMIDKVVARWVNKNFTKHNKNRRIKLIPFDTLNRYTSLRDADFQSYVNWVSWCNEVALILTEKTAIKWRARDVEMAVFAAERNNSELNVL